MISITLRNLLANKARVGLITLAIVIGVAFVSSTFVFSDSLAKTFDELATDITSGTDLEVRPINEFGSTGELTNATASTMQQLDGVRAVAAVREAEDVLPITDAGEQAALQGFATSWVDDPALNLFSLTNGRAPGPGEFVLSAAAAERDGFELGQTYSISTPTGLIDRELVGLSTLDGGEMIEANVTFTILTLVDAQRYFGGDADRIDRLGVSLDSDASADAVQAAAADRLSDQLEVVSQRTIEQEQAAQFNAQISLLRNLLLGFAVVSLFVSVFIIYNAFGIIVSQRIREIGLLRAVGADRSQIRRSILGEAALMGLIASVLGLLAGLALNAGLIALFDRFASFPDMETIITMRTIIVALAVGIGVTLVSVISPARKAGQVSPVTAMRGTQDEEASMSRRMIGGGVVAAVGLGAALFGMFIAGGTPSLIAIGAGLIAVFVGVSLLSPVIAGPVIRTLGTPLGKLRGMSGALARDNAARNRRRTATTAAALMIGLSLITTTLVVGQSVKSHLAETLTNTVSADFVVSNDFDPMTGEVSTVMAGLEELDHILPSSEIEVELAGEVREADVAPIASVPTLFDLGFSETVGDTTGSGAALSTDLASELGFVVGDQIEVRFENSEVRTFTVDNLYTDTTLFGPILLDRDTVVEATGLATIEWVGAAVADGVPFADAEAALLAALEPYPQVAAQTSDGYRESIEAQIDQLLSVVNVMLALSIVIALIGIGLTLALSVFERTREIGLLRAVGMSRRQVRSMVRWEAALIALFGAVLGVGMGLFYGWGAVTALPNDTASAIAVPVGQIGVLVVASAAAGLFAALLPARRAGRMNVLDAITGRSN